MKYSHNNKFVSIIKNISVILFLLCLLTFVCLSIFLPLILKGFSYPKAPIIVILSISFVLSASLFVVFIPPKFDSNFKRIIAKALNTKNLYFDRKYLYVEYDKSIKEIDLKIFANQITQKSKKFTYYIDYITSVNQHNKSKNPIMCIRPLKLKLPIYSEICNDTKWDAIHLGEALDVKLEKIIKIDWNIGSPLVIIDNGADPIINNVLGHVDRFSDDFQCFVFSDSIKVLDSYKGIKKVNSDYSQTLGRIEKIMRDRINFVATAKFNNVFELEGEVDFFNFFGKTYQFDEFFTCKINRKIQILTIDDIYSKVNAGIEILVDVGSVNGTNVDTTHTTETKLLKKDIIKINGNFKPKAILIIVDDSISGNLEQIGNLGKSAGVYICFCGRTVKHNIKIFDDSGSTSIAFGNMDLDTLTLLFKEHSAIFHNKLNNKGIIKYENNVFEFQPYRAIVEKDFILNTQVSTKYPINSNTSIKKEDIEPPVVNTVHVDEDRQSTYDDASTINDRKLVGEIEDEPVELDDEIKNYIANNKPIATSDEILIWDEQNRGNFCKPDSNEVKDVKETPAIKPSTVKIGLKLNSQKPTVNEATTQPVEPVQKVKFKLNNDAPTHSEDVIKNLLSPESDDED